MSPKEIKAVVKKYRRKAEGILLGFCMFGILSNYLINWAMIEKRFDLGLPMPEFGSSYLLPLLCMGLYVVLYVCFNAFENILLQLFASKEAESGACGADS